MLTPKQLDKICENATRARTLEDFVRGAAQAANWMLDADGPRSGWSTRPKG
jgi:hypothetical protein